MRETMPPAFIDDAFERIEETILPCLAALLESLGDAAAGIATTDPKALAAELRSLGAELDGLTQAVGQAGLSLVHSAKDRVAAA